MTNRMEWRPIETARFTLVFKGDIREFNGNPFHADTQFGRPVASCIGSALDECAAAEDRISELEAEVERLKEDVSRQMDIANSECARAEKAEMERDKWARLCEQETARYEAADAGRRALDEE